MRRCGECEYLKIERFRGTSSARCMNPAAGRWSGRVISYIRLPEAEKYHKDCPKPKWCRK